MSTINFMLRPIPPFRLDLTVWTLKRRPEYVIDDWDGERYRRVLRINADTVAVTVQQRGGPDEAELCVEARGAATSLAVPHRIQREIARLLGAELDLSEFYRLAAGDGRLAELANRFRGFKPPRYPTLFECLTNAIVCQLVSLSSGLTIVSRLVNRFGERVRDDPAFPPAFPTPTAIASANPDDLRGFGMTRQKARALIELASGIERGALNFSTLSELDDVTAIRQLTELRGVGRWTAEYALLRGLGRIHVFPGDDVGARNTLQAWIGEAEPLTYDRVTERLDRWRPYAGLVYFQMLLLGLESKGLIQSNERGQ